MGDAARASPSHACAMTGRSSRSAGWWAAALVLGTIGVPAARLLLDPVSLGALALCASMIAGSLRWAYLLENHRPAWPALHVAWFAPVCMAASIGWCALLGPWGLAVPLLLGVARPGFLRTVAPHVRSAVVRMSGGSAGEGSAAGELRALDTRQLCRLWQESTRALEVAWRSQAEVHRIVAARVAYLDELERRDPEAFRTWWPQAGASVNPSNHFRLP